MVLSETDYQVRWLIRSDLKTVLGIEESSFNSPWTENDFLVCLRQRNVIGTVIQKRESSQALGFMLHALEKTHFEILNLAIHPDYRRLGLGETLVGRLKKKLDPSRRTFIKVSVSEYNLEGQLFFSSIGFKATAILSKFYLASDVDSYLMEYFHPSEDEAAGLL